MESETVKKLLGKRIKELRKKQNLTQDNLAELVGIASKNISNIEIGESYPTHETLRKIAHALNVEERDLFSFYHTQNTQDLEKEVLRIFREQPREKQELLYKIAKAFD